MNPSVSASVNRLSPAHARLGVVPDSLSGTSPGSSSDSSLDAALDAVDAMPTLLRTHAAMPAGWLVDLSPLRRWLVRGGQAGDWLATHGLPVPDELFRVETLAGMEDAFVVRTGTAEFVVHDGPAAALHARFGAIPSSLVAGTRILVRDDLEVALGGEAAAALMSEFCALDLSDVANRFLLTRVAGVSAWLCVEGTGAGRWYRIGCDPSYGDYLYETLLDGVRGHGGGPLGFLDFYESKQEA